MSVFNYLLDRSLAHVKRFNNRLQHNPESDAEHSFYTAHFAHILCVLLKVAGVKVDLAKVLAMALIHDLEEGQTGDILNPFKHHDEEVTAAIGKVSEQMIGEMVTELPGKVKEEILGLWHEEQARETIESQIVKVADSLSLLSKCDEEIQTGNKAFQEIYVRELNNLKSQDWEWWSKIKAEVLAGAEKEV